MIALLRGINVGGHKRVPMAELREVATALGFTRVSTFIQSGNLVFAAPGDTHAVQTALETAITARFGFNVDVIVRTRAQWQAHAAGSPFAQAQAQRPHLVLLGLYKQPPQPGAQDALQACARSGERVVVTPEAVWIDYANSVGSTKLTPTLLNRTIGSPVTARNWRTVQALMQMADAVQLAEDEGPA